MEKRLQRNLIIAALVAGLACAAILAWLYFHYRESLPPINELRTRLMAFLETIPAPLYFLAFVILPALGVPLTVFYLTALPILGRTHPVLGLLLALGALVLNMVLTNYLARGILHPVIEKIIRRRGLAIPKLKPHNEWRIVLAMRLSPLPWALQNYTLAMGHARWRTYLWASLLIQGAIGTAVMLVGTSILTGGLGYILLALCGILILQLVLDYIRKRLSRDRSDSLQ